MKKHNTLPSNKIAIPQDQSKQKADIMDERPQNLQLVDKSIEPGVLWSINKKVFTETEIVQEYVNNGNKKILKVKIKIPDIKRGKDSLTFTDIVRDFITILNATKYSLDKLQEVVLLNLKGVDIFQFIILYLTNPENFALKERDLMFLYKRIYKTLTKFTGIFLVENTFKELGFPIVPNFLQDEYISETLEKIGLQYLISNKNSNTEIWAKRQEGSMAFIKNSLIKLDKLSMDRLMLFIASFESLDIGNKDEKVELMMEPSYDVVKNIICIFYKGLEEHSEEELLPIMPSNVKVDAEKDFKQLGQYFSHLIDINRFFIAGSSTIKDVCQLIWQTSFIVDYGAAIRV